MRYFPAFDEFVDLAKSYNMVPVYRQLMSDLLTPVSAFCKIQEEGSAFLFESVIGGERHGRYSFLGTSPFLRFQAFGKKIIIQEDRPGKRKQEYNADDPLSELQKLLDQYRSPVLGGLPRFTGGAVGYAAYDSVRYVENLPSSPPDDRHLPDFSFGFYDQMIIFDHIQKTVKVVSVAHVDPNDLEGSYQRACRQIDRSVEQLQQREADLQITDIDCTGQFESEISSNFTKNEFCEVVEKAKQYILSGDIFQVVLSQRLQTLTTARSFDIYRALRVLNPSPFMFYIKSGQSYLIGSSPEIMVRVYEDEITTRPLAGTRKRGKTPSEDKLLEADLLSDPKELAEHYMLVDLGRNDVGRISQFGSVRLHDLLTVEYYSHVMHISSTVTGKLLPNRSCLDALRSCLPAGTLSGAPKVRAMQIIDELEPHRRGPYGGAIGYIDFTGNMDTCIALRTIVLLGQTAYVQAGAGIVADSNPEMEYQETMNKAMGLLRAIELAEKQL